MDSARELTQLLRNGDIPVEKRINLAKNVFMSSLLSFQSIESASGGKEDISLEWLCYVIGKGISSEAWSVLEECILSRRIMEVKSVYITPSTRSLLVSTICELMMRDNTAGSSSKRSISVIACGVRLLDVPIFNRHFSQTVSDYALLMGTMLKLISSMKADCVESELCRKILHSLSTFSKKFYSNEKFRNLFSCYILSPLSKVLENEETTPEYQRRLALKDSLRCVHVTLFPRKMQREEWNLLTRVLFQIIGGQEVSMETDITLIQVLRNASRTLSCDELLPLLSLVFRCYICSCPKDAEKHCQSFLLLCCLFGFTAVAASDRPAFSQRAKQDSFPTITYSNSESFALQSLEVLLGALNRENVSTNVDVAGHSFVAWLRALGEHVVSVGVCDATIKVLTALSDLDPNILDSPGVMMGPVMRHASSCPAYPPFLSSLLRSSVRVHRVQKLASRLLSSAKQEPLLPLAARDAPPFFPREFLSEFRESMRHLRGTQATAMMRTLTFHLLHDCVDPLESGPPDASAVLLLQLTKCLFCEFMVGYKAIDPNIPELQSEKFISLMSELGGCLGRLGRALLLEKHSPDMMGAFLELSVCWGDLYPLLLFYRPDLEGTEGQSAASPPSPLTPPLPLPHGTATDFSCLHTHLTEGEWSHLVERIVNFGDDACKDMLDELVLQKLRALVLFEPHRKRDAKAAACVQHLLTRAGQSPHTLSLLVQSQAMVVPLLEAADLTRFVALCMPGAAPTAVAVNGSHWKALCCNPSIAPEATVTLLGRIGGCCAEGSAAEGKSRKRGRSQERGGSEEEEGPKRKALGVHELLPRLVAEAMVGWVGGNDDDDDAEGRRRLLLEAMASRLSTFLVDGIGEGNGSSLAQCDVHVLRRSLEALNALPLPHLPGHLRVLVCLCLVVLLILCRQQSQRSEWIEMEMVTMQALLLTLKAFSVFRELVSYLDVGKFLAFFISVDHSEARQQCGAQVWRAYKRLEECLLERMVELSMSRTAGLKQMKVAAKAVNARLKEGAADVNLVCRLASLLMSAFSKKNRRSSSEKLPMKQLCCKCHESLAACVMRRLDFSPSAVTREALECLGLALERFSMLKDRKRLSKAATFLPGVIEEVRKALMGTSPNALSSVVSSDPEIAKADSREVSCCCIAFVEKLVSLRVQLSEWCPPTLVWSLWRLLLSVPASSELDGTKLYTKALKTLLLSANKKEFKLFCDDLLKRMEGGGSGIAVDDEGAAGRRHLVVWGVLVQVPLARGLAEMREATLKAAVPLFLRLVRHWEAGHCWGTALIVHTLEFERILLRSRKVSASHHTIDLVLATVSAAPLLPLGRVGAEYERVFASCANALLALVTHQMACLADRIPPFLQQLLRLFRSVVVHGNVEFSAEGGPGGGGGRLSEELIAMTDCSMSVEWICSALVRHKKDFTRVSPYVIADMVCCFEDHIVHPDIKVHLHNSIYVFIYLCDSSAMVQLQNSLPVGAREVFRNILDNYKKYYKFKGKI